jgi:hypothetical protein
VKNPALSEAAQYAAKSLYIPKLSTGTVVTEVIQKHMDGEAQRLSYDFERLTSLINHRDPDIRELVKRLMYMHEMFLHNMFGTSMYWIEHKYNYGHDVISFIEFIDYFVNHQIIDHGTPGLGHYRSTLMDPDRYEGYMPCLKDDKDASPFIHGDWEFLLTECGDAKHCTLEDVIPTIDFYEAKRAQMAEFYSKEEGFEEELTYYKKPSKWQEELVAIHTELCHTT